MRRVVTLCSLLSLGLVLAGGAVALPADTTAHSVDTTAHSADTTAYLADTTARPADDGNTTGSTAITTGDGTGPSTDTAVATAPHATPDSTGTTESVVDQQVTLSLTPDEPGRVRVVYRYKFPSYLASFRVRLNPRTELSATEGFTRENDSFVWDESTGRPTITVDYRVNRTSTDTGAERVTDETGTEQVTDETGTERATAETGLLFVDTGPWALVGVPWYSADWRYPSDEPAPTLRQRVRTDGPGVAGTEMAFLGAHTVHERTAHGQQFRLVVPQAADLNPTPAAVLDTTSAASDTLRVGNRDERVTLFAAPTGPEWAVRGLQTGETDAWVRADEPVTTPGNVWLHEYVHTRQSYTTTDETRWLTEGAADYYAALLSLRQGLIDYDAFAATLQRGRDTRVEATVLTRWETWGAFGNYHVGALVAGDLDRRMREAGGGSLDEVVAAMNAANGSFTAADLARVLRELGGSSTATAGERYTTTTDRPPVWNRSVYAAAFQTAALTTETAPPRVTGPYRNGTLPTRVVVPGETVAVDTTVENVGSEAGSYRLVATLDGDRVATRTGELPPGASTTVTMRQSFAAPGDYTFVVGDATLSLTVVTPATPRVDAVTVDPETVSPGEAVTVRATVSNPADRPANGTVAVGLGDRRVTTRQLRLAAGETTTLTATVTPDSAGTYTVRVGDQTTTVRATTPTASPTRTRSATTTEPSAVADRAAGTADSTPGTTAASEIARGETTATDGSGVGVVVAVAALVATVLVSRLRPD